MKNHWIQGLAIAAVVLIYVGLSQYHISRVLVPQSLSTRGLPVPATDVPVVLPPDPGEAGKATLAGIDSDKDGVRDDLQREIVYMYPQNDEVRRVLRAMVKKGQDMITTEGDHEHFKALMVGYSAFWDCYDFLVFGKNLANDTNFHILDHMLQNTSQREKKFQENDYIAKPYSTEINLSSEACTKSSVQGQY